MKDKLADLGAKRIELLKAEIMSLKRALTLSHGHEDTSVSYQESVLVDRYLPEGTAVTFRLGPPPGGEAEIICQLFNGSLELTVLNGSVELKLTEANRVLLIEGVGPEEEFLPIEEE